MSAIYKPISQTDAQVKLCKVIGLKTNLNIEVVTAKFSRMIEADRNEALDHIKTLMEGYNKEAYANAEKFLTNIIR